MKLQLHHKRLALGMALFFAVALVIAAFPVNQKPSLQSQLRDGDVLFQTTSSNQAKAIQLATESEYSHCGIAFNENGQWMVYEAVQPVRKTALKEWIDRGIKQHYAVKRYKDELTSSQVVKMKQVAQSHLGKSYDLAFNWDDTKMYCSELVYKVFEHGAGIELCTKRKLRDFKLDHPIVRQKLKERYGDSPPLDEPMVSPEDIFRSAKLESPN